MWHIIYMFPKTSTFSWLPVIPYHMFYYIINTIKRCISKYPISFTFRRRCRAHLLPVFLSLNFPIPLFSSVNKSATFIRTMSSKPTFPSLKFNTIITSFTRTYWICRDIVNHSVKNTIRFLEIVINRFFKICRHIFEQFHIILFNGIPRKSLH